MYEVNKQGRHWSVVSAEGEAIALVGKEPDAQRIADALNALAPGGAVEKAREFVRDVSLVYGGNIGNRATAVLAAMEAK